MSGKGEMEIEDLFDLYGELIVVVLWGGVSLGILQWMLQMAGG